MLGSLATFGYANKATLWELQQVMRVNPQAIIVDTRLQPSCSWSHIWQRRTLEIAWQDRYVYQGQWLGNINYNNNTLPIHLANAEQGIPWIIQQLEQGHTLILLCACAHYETCHRRVIYNHVKRRLGEQWQAYTLGQRVLTPCGPGMIDPDIPIDVHRARNQYGVNLDTWNPRRYFFSHELEPLEERQPLTCVQQSLIA